MIKAANPHQLYECTRHLRGNKKWDKERYEQILNSISRYGYAPSYRDIINVVEKDGEITYLEGHKRLSAIHFLNKQDVIAVKYTGSPDKLLRIDGRTFYLEHREDVIRKILDYPRFQAGYHPIKYLPHLSTEQARTECNRMLNQIKQEIGDITNTKILDVGPFFGFFSLELAESGADVVGVEVERDNYEICNCVKRLYGLSNVEFVNSDIVDYGNSDYDYVLMLNMFHYLYQQRGELAWSILNRYIGCRGLFLAVNHEMLGLDNQKDVPSLVLNKTRFTYFKDLGEGRINKREGMRNTFLFWGN